MTPVLAGYRERINLPEWGITGLIAKLDTGARTSSIHVENLVENPDGTITFDVILSRLTHKSVTITAQPIETVIIISSNGHESHRHLVRTALELGQFTHEIDISLASRGNLSHRMLLGRSALPSPIAVVPSASFLIS